ncbi:MAG: NIL domain-containing protein [Verrucomicrobiae bacterium]|nr:NIL domain-containing protein [Verrucomicrobiae bacterium]
MATKKKAVRPGPGWGGGTSARGAASKTGDRKEERKEKRRFWLTYPTRLITSPVIWQLSQKFPIVFNVRQASVTDEIGILCLELEATRTELKAAISWLEKQGVKVEPVEINVIES